MSHLHGWAKEDGEWHCVDCGVRYEDGQEARARTTDPDTSHEAAASTSKIKMTTVRISILKLLTDHGPMTDEQIWRGLEYEEVRDLTSPSGARTRRSELVAARKVRDTGLRGKGKTGRKMIVWAITE